MIDKQAFQCVPGNIKALFQRLNGDAMYDILDTLDALLKEKNFYPNFNNYRKEIDDAGIFVTRMEVAMSAVLSKNASKVTNTALENFLDIQDFKLKQLPADQKQDIKNYWIAGPVPGLLKSAVSPGVATLPFDHYVDLFKECRYDVNYKVTNYFSTTLQLTFEDGAQIELDIEKDFIDVKLTPVAARDAIAQGRVGAGNRIFPTKLTKQTVGRLWSCREEAINIQNEAYANFAKLAVTGVTFVLEVPAFSAGALESGAVGAGRARRRPIKSESADAPKLLPRLSRTSQEQISALMKEHPGLSNANAERAVRGPEGSFAKLSGAERSGAAQLGKAPDIEFRHLSPNGNVVLRREVKVWEGTQGRFDAAVSDAADQLISQGSGGEIWIQAPQGTNARSAVQRFKGAGSLTREQQAARLGRYRSIKLKVVEPDGNVLLEELLELPPLRTE